MRHSVRQAVSGLTLISCSLAALPAGAQDTAGCPKDGTVISAKNTTGLYNSTARGSDPKDASVCIGVSEGPGSGVNNGREVRRIYGYYDLTTYNMSSTDQERARAALESLLTGARNEVEFELTEYLVGTRYAWTSNEHWKRTGQASLSVGGRSINAVSFQLETKYVSGSSQYHGVWDLWYDPVSHIWLKGHVTMLGGTSRIQDNEVLSISSP
jgi:hypothetical protein